MANWEFKRVWLLSSDEIPKLYIHLQDPETRAAKYFEVSYEQGVTRLRDKSISELNEEWNESDKKNTHDLRLEHIGRGLASSLNMLEDLRHVLQKLE